MKMRKFPDQGSSKLLWGRGAIPEGELPPPTATYDHHIFKQNVCISISIKNGSRQKISSHTLKMRDWS